MPLDRTPGSSAAISPFDLPQRTSSKAHPRLPIPDYTQQMAGAYLETLSHHSRNGSLSHQSTASTPAPFFSKFKGISRSKSPNDLRPGAHLSLIPTSGGSYNEPRSPSSGNGGASFAGSDRPHTPWSADSTTSTSPRQPRFRSRGGLLKKPFSPTNGGVMASLGQGLKGRPRNASSLSNEEFDPTTLRKHTVRRKNPSDVYDQYDDLFDDSLDDAETDSELTESDDGYGSSQHYSRDVYGASQRPRSPPRSVPSQMDLSQNASKTLPYTKWKSTDDNATPPQSKPPSLLELPPPSPIQLSFTMPPTPPPKSSLPPGETPTTLSTDMFNITASSDTPRRQIDNASSSAGLSQSRNGSVKSKAPSFLDRTGNMRAISSEELRILNMLPSSAGSVSWPQELSLRFSKEFQNPALFPMGSEPSTPRIGVDKEMSMMCDGGYFGVEVAPLSQKQQQQQRASAETKPKQAVQQQGGAATSAARITITTENHSRKYSNAADDILRAFDTAALFNDTDFADVVRIASARDLDDKLALDYPQLSPTTISIPVLQETQTQIERTNSEIPPVDTMKEVSDPPTVTETTIPTVPGNKSSTSDAAHLKVFKQFLKDSGENDAFIHRFPRFDALQTTRICKSLVLDAPMPRKGKGAAEATPEAEKLSRERKASEQMRPTLWALMAFRWLMAGRIIFSPAHDLLASAGSRRIARRLLDGTKPVKRTYETERRRVLDLGGLPVGDWGWHCAYDYPDSKVYTVTAREVIPSSCSNSSNSEDGSVAPVPETPKPQGPRNHRHITVSHLWRLPFPDNHFDVVSARHLFNLLKLNQHARRNPLPSTEYRAIPHVMDEYDLCIEECLRVLKPGGYIEFFLFDHDIINPGPLGSELGARFTTELEASSYDPTPTKKWIHRLSTAGFKDIKRSWIILPMTTQVKPKAPPKENGHEPEPVRKLSENPTSVREEVRRKLEAWEEPDEKVKGSTESAAPVTGLLGSYIWENWMQKANAESKAQTGWELAPDVITKVLEEGRERGSGWRTMIGWARKPVDSNSGYGYNAMGLQIRKGSVHSK